jgi:putative ABC transport system permease protein
MLFSTGSGSGSGLDEKSMSTLVQQFAPGSTITYRDQYVSQLENAPLENLAQEGYLFGVIAAICFGLCAVLLSLALTSAARDRRLLLLTMLGLTAREARRIAWAETSPLAVTAALGGLAAAACLPAVIGSSLNLTAFTGLAAEGPLKSDLAVPLLAALGAVAFTMLTVAVQAAAARRRRAASVLRIGTGDES